jgi:hypothetical protein
MINFGSRIKAQTCSSVMMCDPRPYCASVESRKKEGCFCTDSGECGTYGQYGSCRLRLGLSIHVASTDDVKTRNGWSRANE